MDSTSLVAIATLLACAIGGLLVGRRRESATFTRTWRLLLAALALWTLSSAVLHGAQSDPGRALALRLALLGACATPLLWMLLALRLHWPRRTSGVGLTAAALAPGLAYTVLALADPSFAWFFLDDPGADAVLSGTPRALSLAMLITVTLAGSTATGLFVYAAARMWRRRARPAAVSMWIGLTFPSLVALGAHGDVFRPTAMAASMALTTLVLAAALRRFGKLEPPPIGHRQVIDHLRHGVLIADADGEILDHNAAAELLLGRTPHGSSLGDALASLAPSERRREVLELCEAGGLGELRSLRLESVAGRHLEVSVQSIQGEHDRAVAQVAVLRDRSDEARYATAALRAEQVETVGTLAAGIAHEVNNPLAFVRANLSEVVRWGESVEARRCRGESKLAEDLAELGELAGEALEGLGRIERAVADVRRLAATPSTVEEGVPLDVVALEALRLAELRADRGFRVETRLAPDLPLFPGSRQLLVHAVLNLLLNAQAALESTPDARIEVESGRDAEGLWLRVRDNGPGISDELRDSVFEPFFTTTEERSGLGLGIAADIARDHGGSLDCEACESGASFVLRVALAVEG